MIILRTSLHTPLLLFTFLSPSFSSLQHASLLRTVKFYYHNEIYAMYYDNCGYQAGRRGLFYIYLRLIAISTRIMADLCGRRGVAGGAGGVNCALYAII